MDHLLSMEKDLYLYVSNYLYNILLSFERSFSQTEFYILEIVLWKLGNVIMMYKCNLYIVLEYLIKLGKQLNGD